MLKKNNKHFTKVFTSQLNRVLYQCSKLRVTLHLLRHINCPKRFKAANELCNLGCGARRKLNEKLLINRSGINCLETD